MDAYINLKTKNLIINIYPLLDKIFNLEDKIRSKQAKYLSHKDIKDILKMVNDIKTDLKELKPTKKF